MRLRLPAWLSRMGGVRAPSDVAVPLEPEERVTGWARTGDGAVVATTSRGLFVATPASLRQHSPLRLPWQQIVKATWSDGTLTVVPSQEIEEAAGARSAVITDAPPYRWRLPHPGNVPAEIRTRVTRSIAYSQRHALINTQIWIVARRVAGRDGLEWMLRLGPDTNWEDPAVQEAAFASLARVRAQESV